MLDLHKDFEIFNFPGGEVNVRLKNFPTDDCFIVTLIARLKNSNDIMSLLLAVDVLKRENVFINELIIPYFPYARQDRVCNKGEALSVKVIADLINSLNIPKVTILDPHSDVTPALINNVNIISQVECFTKSMWTFGKSNLEIRNDYYIICPDAGARKRIDTIAKEVQTDKVIYFNKKRDLLTGNILGIDSEYQNFKNKKCIIIDDICDGGRTFIEIAKYLKSYDADEIILYITHGIFSKGLECLKEAGIDKIFTTNSYQEIDDRYLNKGTVPQVLQYDIFQGI